MRYVLMVCAIWALYLTPMHAVADAFELSGDDTSLDTVGQLPWSVSLSMVYASPLDGNGTAVTSFGIRYTTESGIGFGGELGHGIFSHSIPGQRWIGFQLVPIEAQASYAFQIGENLQPYFLLGVGGMWGRSELFLVDTSIKESAFGFSGSGAVGVEIDVARTKETQLDHESAFQFFVQAGVRYMNADFKIHEVTDITSIVVGGGVVGKW